MSILQFDCRHEFAGGFRFDAALTTTRRFTALFGPSGSGKTTLLSMIVGYLRPQWGQISLNGRLLLDTARQICLPPERRNVGIVPQDAALFPHMSVESNLRYGLCRRGQTEKTSFAKVVEVLEVGPLLKRMPRNLSGGERQRVALGRALLSGPELMLMDEPLSSLDARLRGTTIEYIRRVVKEWDVPLLYVTHSREEIETAAEEAVRIEWGRVVGKATGQGVALPASLADC